MTSKVRPQLSEEQAEQFVLDTRPWMSCDECFDYLDQFLDLEDSAEASELVDPAGASEWVPAMLAHLTGCEVCREEVESMRVLLSSDS